MQDRNFDNLVDKFEKKVYDTVKGEWRLKLLQEDLAPLRAQAPLQIWDAGCGFAQISQWFAEAGHQLTLCDLSAKMLARAQQQFTESKVSANFIHGSAQSVAQQLPQQDLVLFHAVLEWLVEPQATLNTVAQRVKPGGTLSLLFYNRHALVIRNALRGGWRLPYLLEDAYLGKGKKLTPPNPQIPEEVCAWLTDWGFEIEVHTGIRVFHDYMTQEAQAQSDLPALMALEYRYCREPTYRNMARYIHLRAKRKTDTTPETGTIE
ncbi:MAG: methyltransferase domain-containing protein [Thiotrichales bacterium]|nr:methyltransferase domain-containing protein [Thiotrichales bacterium]